MSLKHNPFDRTPYGLRFVKSTGEEKIVGFEGLCGACLAERAKEMAPFIDGRVFVVCTKTLQIFAMFEGTAKPTMIFN